MKSSYTFSIIIAIYNTEKYLIDAIDSIINQSYDFNDVQLILVNDGSIDSCSDICNSYKKKYPNNVFCLFQENSGQTVARNNGLKIAKGKYINFLDSDDKLDLNTLSDVKELFDKAKDTIDVVTIPRYNFGKSNGPSFLVNKYKPTRIVDIKKEYDFPIVSISASFIRKEALAGNFDSRLIISEDSLLLNKTILKKCKFGVVSTSRYLYRKREEGDSTIDTKKNQKEYFIPRVLFYFNELINYSILKWGHVIKYIQNVLMYDIQWFFIDDTHIILNDDELREFLKLIKKVLQYVDDDIILSQRFLNKILEYSIISFKYNKPNFKIKEYSNDVYLYYENKLFDKLSNYQIILSDVKIFNDILYVKGFFDSCFEDVKIRGYLNNHISIINRIPHKEKSLIPGSSCRYNFNGVFNLNKNNNQISFKVFYNSKEYPVKILNRSSNKQVQIRNNQLYL